MMLYSVHLLGLEPGMFETDEHTLSERQKPLS